MGVEQDTSRRQQRRQRGSYKTWWQAELEVGSKFEKCGELLYMKLGGPIDDGRPTVITVRWLAESAVCIYRTTRLLQIESSKARSGRQNPCSAISDIDPHQIEWKTTNWAVISQPTKPRRSKENIQMTWVKPNQTRTVITGWERVCTMTQ